jgi:hypothetical protein
MTAISQDVHRTAQTQSSTKRKKPRHKTTRDCPRVTLCLSVEDHERLKAVADGMALSTFIRAKALGDTLPRRKHRSTTSVADIAALAQLLGLLGQSRIANNLNQLAYHANIGALPVDDVTRDQISEAYDNVLEMRTALVTALGLRP